MRWYLYEKKKSRLCRKIQLFNNNVICYRSAFVKTNGPGVLVEIVSIRGGPAAVTVICENTEAANSFVVVT